MRVFRGAGALSLSIQRRETNEGRVCGGALNFWRPAFAERRTFLRAMRHETVAAWRTPVLWAGCGSPDEPAVNEIHEIGEWFFELLWLFQLRDIHGRFCDYRL